MNYQNPRPFNDSSGNQVVTFSQMCSQLKIDSADESDWFTDAIDAATEAAESALGASLLQRTIVAKYYWMGQQPYWWNSQAEPGKLYLPQGPVSSITSVVDTNGNNITNYQLAGSGTADFIQIYQSFTPPLTVRFVAGYGTVNTQVPADIRMAIRTHVASMWRTRESVTELKFVPMPHSLEMFYQNKKRSIPIA